MNWRVEFDGMSTSRIEIQEAQVDVIREIVVNVFAHANYSSITEHEIDISKSTPYDSKPNLFVDS